MTDYDIIVIGSGPAGMMASIEASKETNNKKLKIALIERNASAGKKLLITGGGRCNITSNKDISDFYQHIVRNPKFLYSSFSSFDNRDLTFFFEKGNIVLKTEGNKIYPEKDDAGELLKYLLKEIKKNEIDLILNSYVSDIEILKKDNSETYALTVDRDNSKSRLTAKHLILATGGASYKATGSDGSMLSIVERMGIKIVPVIPTLVRLTSNQPAITESQGISLNDVKFSVYLKNKKIAELSDSIVFTHNGISGPGAINSSSFITDKPLSEIKVTIDFLPAISFDNFIEIIKSPDKQKLTTRISRYLPKELVKNILMYDVISRKSFEKYRNHDSFPEHEVMNMKKNQINDIAESFKNFELKLTGHGGLNEAIVTRGGIDIKEINPRTLNLKKHPGIFVAGEMIDVDAFTGGYNLQIAFSTGCLSGKSARDSLFIREI